MTKFVVKNLLFALLLLASIRPASAGDADHRYAQLILKFPSVRDYNYTFNRKDNAIILNLKDTSPEELEALNHYDEKLIRRVLIRDHGMAGSEVSLVLKDEAVRATITDFKEPFRIIIDLFDKNFSEGRDPITGLPLLHGVGAALSGQDATGPQPMQLLSQDGRSEASASKESRPSTKRPRRLLQPIPSQVKTPNDMMAALKKVAAGLGQAWDRYPIYIYRMQTGPYKTGKSYDSYLSKKVAKAMDSSEAMADYASQLFDFGHEGRALIAYQQVLHSAPLIFDKNATHLWKLAEIHLGQGNLTLADGYYQSLREKHPDSPLASFADLRRLDIKAIEFARVQNVAGFGQLVARLGGIRPDHNAELKAQVALRRAFWSSDAAAHVIDQPDYIPQLDPNTSAELEDASEGIESQKTAFLAASLLLNHKLDDRPTRMTAEAAGAYFKRYHGPATEPYRSKLLAKFQSKLNQAIQSDVQEGKFLDAIQAYESLPPDLDTVKETFGTAWAMGEAYRVLGQPDRASGFYKSAADLAKEGPKRFRSLFWYAESVGQALAAQKARSGGNVPEQRLRQAILNADKGMQATWNDLKSDEKNRIFAEMKPQLEATVTAETMLRTPPKIVLEAWTQTLSTEVSAASSDPTEWQRNYSPTANTVRLLSDLAKRFAALGQRSEEHQARELLKRIKPSQFQGDKEAQDVWVKELLVLANEQREANQYLEAGRTYTFAGSEGGDFEGRAEALYKGGLLLYRAGRREEAVEAFKKASQDPNNLLYADLAKKRLNQLQQ